MTARSQWLALTLALAGGLPAPGAPVEPRSRSISGSKQFIVYCSDRDLRSQVIVFVEDVKAEARKLLGEQGEADRWKIPIVLNLLPASGPGQPPVRLQMIATPEGSKIEITAEIGSDLAAIHLQKQILRAYFLEFAWRNRPPIVGGERYLEPPWWLVEGAIQIIRRRDLGVDSELFRRLTEHSKLPPIEQFLTLNPTERGATAEAIDGACAMALVQLLLEQPNGRANLARLLTHWPSNGDNPLSALAKDFPALGGSDGTLKKWWTLNLARFAAAERYRGLSAEATEKQLVELLKFDLVVDAAGTRTSFTLAEYEKFLRLPSARAAFLEKQTALTNLSTQAHALFRPVLADYQEVLSLLSRGKTRPIADRLASIERYRSTVLHRMGEISDYLNWYEATQLGTRTNAFDSYLKAVKELSNLDNRRSDPIAQYLDQIQAEF